jgi:hypothetical protein
LANALTETIRMASRAKTSNRPQRDSDSLEALKPVVVLVLFGTILYGAYSVVQKGPAPATDQQAAAPAAVAEAPAFAPPEVQLAAAPPQAPSLTPAASAPPPSPVQPPAPIQRDGCNLTSVSEEAVRRRDGGASWSSAA